MRRSPELMQFEIGISTMRYFPASGTAGFERSLVSGNRRVPAPPPMMMARLFSVIEAGIERLIVRRELRRPPRDDGQLRAASQLQVLKKIRRSVSKARLSKSRAKIAVRLPLAVRSECCHHASKTMCGIIGYIGKSEAVPILL